MLVRGALIPPWQWHELQFFAMQIEDELTKTEAIQLNKSHFYLL